MNSILVLSESEVVECMGDCGQECYSDCDCNCVDCDCDD